MRPTKLSLPSCFTSPAIEKPPAPSRCRGFRIEGRGGRAGSSGLHYLRHTGAASRDCSGHEKDMWLLRRPSSLDADSREDLLVLHHRV